MEPKTKKAGPKFQFIVLLFNHFSEPERVDPRSHLYHGKHNNLSPELQAFSHCLSDTNPEHQKQ